MSGASNTLKGSNMAAGRGAVTAFADHCEWTGASQDDRAQWLLARRAGVGGSDAAAIMGVSPFKSALALYVEKTMDTPPDEATNEVARWGQLIEPLLLKELAVRTGRKVVRGGKLLRNLASPHRLVTLDGVVLSKPPSWAKGPGVAEAKTTGYGSRYAEDLPVEVQVQIQYELAVTGATWGTCIWLPFPDRQMGWADVAVHQRFAEKLLRRVDDFWDRVKRREPPDPDGSESSMRALRLLYPDDNDEVCRIVRASGIADEYQRNAAAIKLLQERQGLIKNTLLATLKDAKYGLLDDGRYWRTATYKPRTNNCPHCGEVLSRVEGYRTITLSEPRKKPFHVVHHTRRLVVDLDPELVDEVTEAPQLGEGNALREQLEQSLTAAPAAVNDPSRGVA